MPYHTILLTLTRPQYHNYQLRHKSVKCWSFSTPVPKERRLIEPCRNDVWITHPAHCAWQVGAAAGRDTMSCRHAGRDTMSCKHAGRDTMSGRHASRDTMSCRHTARDTMSCRPAGRDTMSCRHAGRDTIARDTMSCRLTASLGLPERHVVS